MLAQTQVTRVIPKWETFLARWPDPAACAAAPVGEVIAAWSGLGYNRRAVFLHRRRGPSPTDHRGVVPADLAASMALPGVGPYTARAVLAFAFEQPVGVVDTNAARVLARAVAGRPLDGRAVQALADRLVPPGAVWAWNQAILDLGAEVCTARRPACDACPLGPGAKNRPAVRAGPPRGLRSRRRLRRHTPGRRRPLPDPTGRPGAGCSPGPSPAQGAARYGRPEAFAAAAGWPDQPTRAARAARAWSTTGWRCAGPTAPSRLP